MYSVTISPVVFNPSRRVFEALVTFQEGADVIRIPCNLRFPIEAPPSRVIPALLRQAREKRNQSRVPMFSRMSWFAEIPNRAA